MSDSELKKLPRGSVQNKNFKTCQILKQKFQKMSVSEKKFKTRTILWKINVASKFSPRSTK